MLFIHEKAFKYVVWKTAAILCVTDVLKTKSMTAYWMFINVKTVIVKNISVWLQLITVAYSGRWIKDDENIWFHSFVGKYIYANTYIMNYIDEVSNRAL